MAKQQVADVYELTLGGPWVVSASTDPRSVGFAAPLNSLYMRSGTAEWYQKVDTLDTAWIPWGSSLSVDGVGYYGNGSDGALVVAGTTTITRDSWYTTIVVQNGGRLNTNGYRVMATTSITVDVGGVVAYDGNNAVTFNAGASGNSGGTLPFGLVGGVGNTGAGSSANNNDYLITGSGSGGNGGLGPSGAGGAGGVLTGAAATTGRWRNLPQFVWASLLSSGSATVVDASCGGGGGGGDGVNRGGGGGGGGGTIVLAAPVIANNGAIRAPGGNGANGIAGNAGGGGGGGGGHVFLLAPIFTGSNPAVTGGTQGSGVGTGVNGVAGSPGSFFRLPV